MSLRDDTLLAACLLTLLPCIACSPGSSSGNADASENADARLDGRADEGAAAAGDGGGSADDTGSASDTSVPIKDAGALLEGSSACPYYLACQCRGGPFDASFTNDWDADIGELHSQEDAALATCNAEEDAGISAAAAGCFGALEGCLIAAGNLVPSPTYTPPVIEQFICDAFFTQSSPGLSACLEAGLPSPPGLVPPDQ